MEVLILQVFVSLCLAAGGVLLFLYSGKLRDVEHADRMALFPIEEERTTPHDARARREGAAEGARAPDRAADQSREP